MARALILVGLVAACSAGPSIEVEPVVSTGPGDAATYVDGREQSDAFSDNEIAPDAHDVPAWESDRELYEDDLIGDRRFDAVAAGGHFMCGIVSGDGHLFCMGSVGRDVTNDVDPGTRSVPLSPGEVPNGSFKALAVSQTGACALRTDGTAACFGGPQVGSIVAPVGVFVRIIAGFHHFCGLRADGTATCWHCVTDGVATACPPLDGTFDDVVAGIGTCARPAGTSAWTCSGFDEFAGDIAGWLNERRLHDVTAGTQFFCGLDARDGLSCAGYARQIEPPPKGAFRSVSVSHDGACALDTRGRAHCWNCDELSGLDGLCTPYDREYRSISVAGGSACGLHLDGRVRCWGGHYSANTQEAHP